MFVIVRCIAANGSSDEFEKEMVDPTLNLPKSGHLGGQIHVPRLMPENASLGLVRRGNPVTQKVTGFPRRLISPNGALHAKASMQ